MMAGRKGFVHACEYGFEKKSNKQQRLAKTRQRHRYRERSALFKQVPTEKDSSGIEKRKRIHLRYSFNHV